MISRCLGQDSRNFLNSTIIIFLSFQILFVDSTDYVFMMNRVARTTTSLNVNSLYQNCSSFGFQGRNFVCIFNVEFGYDLWTCNSQNTFFFRNFTYSSLLPPSYLSDLIISNISMGYRVSNFQISVSNETCNLTPISLSFYHGDGSIYYSGKSQCQTDFVNQCGLPTSNYYNNPVVLGSGNSGSDPTGAIVSVLIILCIIGCIGCCIY